MTTVVLEGKSREVVGSGAAKALRRAGIVPGILYGDNQTPEQVSIDRDLLNRYLRKSNFFSTVFEIQGVGKSGQKFVAKDVQFHPVTDQPIHIDFMRVGKGSNVTVRIPLKFINELASPGIKLGGVLNVLVHEIDVICDPEDIPSTIDIDLTGFEFHHTVHAHDVVLPNNVKLPTQSKNFTIATVVAPTIMKVEDTSSVATDTSVVAAETKTA